MGNKSDKLKEQALGKANDAYQQQFKDQVSGWQPSPYEQALNTEGVNWMNATSGPGVPNVASLPGMAPYIDIYNTAIAKQKGRKFGLGSMNFGASQASPNMLAALGAQEEAHRRQDAGQQIQNAYAVRNAEVRGTALPLIGIGESREAGKVGALGGAAQQAAGSYANYQVRPSFMAQLALKTVEQAGQGAMAAATYGARPPTPS